MLAHYTHCQRWLTHGGPTLAHRTCSQRWAADVGPTLAQHTNVGPPNVGSEYSVPTFGPPL